MLGSLTWSQKKRINTILSTTIAYVLMVVGSILFLIPFIWMLSTSLKPSQQVFTFPVEWIPKPFMWRNYIDAVTILPFITYLKNTLIITGSTMFIQLVINTLVAFGFARLRFPGRSFLFFLVLSTLMVPSQVTLIPTFILFKSLNWLDTFKPLIIPSFFGAPYYIFILRQFFLTIPLEMEDAARIDGCSTLGIYSRIILPLSRPVILVIAIFSFLAHWNDFFGPLIYLSSQEKYTLALGLRMFQGMYMTDWNLVMCASVVTVIPCILIFFFTQKMFIQGIVMTGVKG